ncbi:MAG: pyrroline-5-carboxylate reductase [Firmicutes bacterium]|nr:pyrroline-5-carboxylate reductase [Bacillota bacterium]
MNILGFLGAGKMGSAIFRGVARSVDCVYYDISPACRDALASECGVIAEASAADVVTKSDGLVIAVKPQVYPDVAEVIAENHKDGQIGISIMAGITLETLGATLPETAKIIRLMPNMAMTVGAGVCLLAANKNVTEAEKEEVKALLAPMGLVKEIPEHLMDAGTALSGSGPAFFYSMVEAMMIGAVKEGFTRDDAMELTIHTMKGAAALLEQTGHSPAVLRDQMMSAGGTTVAGVCVLEQGSFRGDVIDALSASCKRSKELSGGGKK